MPTGSKAKLPISVIILVHRVDDRLERAIASVQFAEQILLVDQGNQTNTNALKKKFQFEKVTLPAQPVDNFNFAELRNQSLEHATQSWIFFLDSDEVVTPESYQPLANLITNPELNSAYIRRKDIFYGKELKWGEVRNQWLLRIGRKQSLKFLRPVHEVSMPNGNQARSAVTVLHYSHNSIKEFIDKVTFYAKIDAYHRFDYHDTFELWELVLLPPAKLFYNYIVLLGILDGWRGLVYAIVMSLHSLFVRVYLYQLEQPRQMS
jgi:glycosyltransferase involved in cell wall biosynthesis